MGWLTNLTGLLAPFFIIASPILSYSDQAISMHRSKSSAGFSLDIPLIMLVASFLRIFYWPGARFDLSLLTQAILAVGMQVILLKIALDHRPAPSTKGGESGLPFAGAGQDGVLNAQRPYNFWQWRSPKPYWQFLLYLVIGLIVCELVLGLVPPVYALYSSTIGILGLSIEATLPIPQIITNAQRRSCKGLRLSVLGSWLFGDAFKIFWFFTATIEIPWVFKICGMFQASCDAFLGVQYFLYGDGSGASLLGGAGSNTRLNLSGITNAFGWATEKWEEHFNGAQKEGHDLKEMEMTSSYGRQHSRSLTPTRRPAPFQVQDAAEQ